MPRLAKSTTARADARLPLCFALCLAGAGCGATKPAAATPSPVSARPTQPKPPPPLGPIEVRDVGFETPESVLHDPRLDLYLVSNIDGSPLDLDDRAFISRLRPDGSIEQLKWIDAEDPAVRLDAPKGMALVGDVLYVADVASVRKFDRDSGKPLGAIEIPGATFINDVCADADGTVYVSDSGIQGGFTPSGGDAIYKLTRDGQVSVLAKSQTLGRPNGLALDGQGGVWVATFGSGELLHLSAGGASSQSLAPPKGSLDGVVVWERRLFVSSWEGSTVYEREGDSFVERVRGVAAPSDIGFDAKRKRLLIPLFYADALVIYPL
ncbi:MAG TPA: hypothetical protein VFZ61_15885 [Polyangiales bacterium]